MESRVWETAADTVAKKREVYLTFDDGPCRLTQEVLCIIRRYGVKATFFVVGNMVEKHPDIIKEIYEGGHTIGLHCYNHDYKMIYKDAASLSTDIISCRNAVEKILPNYQAKYYRFPGGSFGLPAEYLDAVAALGLEYKDWNAVNGDTEKNNHTTSAAVQCAIDSAAGRNRVIILMHDNKSLTAASLPQIIEYFIANGYVFKSF